MTVPSPPPKIGDFTKQAASLRKLPVSDANLSSLYRSGDDGLSPLIGPMDAATFNCVSDEEARPARDAAEAGADSDRAKAGELRIVLVPGVSYAVQDMR